MEQRRKYQVMVLQKGKYSLTAAVARVEAFGIRLGIDLLLYREIDGLFKGPPRTITAGFVFRLCAKDAIVTIKLNRSRWYALLFPTAAAARGFRQDVFEIKPHLNQQR